jgi:hypothetical protein
MAAVRAVIGFKSKRFVGDCGVRGKGSCRKLSLRAELIGEEAFIEGTVFGIITGSGILDKRRFRRAVIFSVVSMKPGCLSWDGRVGVCGR